MKDTGWDRVMEVNRWEFDDIPSLGNRSRDQGALSIDWYERQDARCKAIGKGSEDRCSMICATLRHLMYMKINYLYEFPDLGLLDLMVKMAYNLIWCTWTPEHWNISDWWRKDVRPCARSTSRNISFWPHTYWLLSISMTRMFKAEAWKRKKERKKVGGKAREESFE